MVDLMVLNGELLKQLNGLAIQPTWLYIDQIVTPFNK
ncbi:hypothetical protein BL107_06389 [Synechococcus sp. BL107]|nr:hypothetical protein BL107_06389 [Synechococcus sp. BL107]